MHTDGLLLLPLPRVQAALLPQTATLTIDVITPPYAGAGSGTLRVVRVDAGENSVALTAAYDGYERL